MCVRHQLEPLAAAPNGRSFLRRVDGRGRRRLAGLHARLLAPQHLGEASRMTAADWYRRADRALDGQARRRQRPRHRRCRGCGSCQLSRRRRAHLVGPGGRRNQDAGDRRWRRRDRWRSPCWSSVTPASSTRANGRDAGDRLQRRSGIGAPRRATGTRLPEVPPPPDIDFDAHPYARDLDRLRPRVVDQVARPAGDDPTAARRLWTWLLAPAAPG